MTTQNKTLLSYKTEKVGHAHLNERNKINYEKKQNRRRYAEVYHRELTLRRKYLLNERMDSFIKLET